MDPRIARATELAVEQMERYTRKEDRMKNRFFKQPFETGISYYISKLLADAHNNPEPKTD